MKILFNNCYGGFGISEEARDLYNKRRKDNEQVTDIRTDKLLIEIVEELGKRASGDYAEIEIAEVPDGAYWYIDEYDGWEEVRYTLTPPPEEYSAKMISKFNEEVE